jgi:hypothetical protein
MRGEAQIVTRPAWLVRYAGRIAKAALIAMVGILGLLGFVTVLAGSGESVQDRRVGSARDLAAQGFAEAFTRAYLTWDSTHPERHEKQVGAFTSESLGPGAGLSVPARGAQHLVWTAAVRDDPVSRSRRLITVAAETNTGVSYFVSVSVQRDRRGLIAVSRYPALVGAPPVDTRTGFVDEPDVDDQQLRTVVGRAVANYLRRERTNLRADLDPEAVIALPAARLKVRSIDSITWVRPGRVAVELQAEGRGATWTLRYELAVVMRDRWYVRSIQTNPKMRRSP